MKLLILGNHTCGNRGDSAILRGLLDAINILSPHAEVDVMNIRSVLHGCSTAR